MRTHNWISAAGIVLALVVTTQLSASPGDERKGGGRWGKNYFPNVQLTTHEGKKVRFFDLIEDKVVVINFIYTTCPDACPLETARLLEVQRILGSRVGSDIFMYSITIDPDRDTPEVLAEYAERFNIGPGWTFLTGKEEDITLIRKKLGLYIADIQDGSNDHNLSLRIGNQKTGRWMKRSPFENPYVLARHIGNWLHNWKLPEANPRSYADAPELRKISKGETLFRTRCASCHTIGGGEIGATGMALVGPDLYGVTQKRDRAWLSRWIAEPDRMLAEKDPLAIELYERYNRVAMPNMQLNPAKVKSLLNYIETESVRVKATSPRLLAAAQDSDGSTSCCLKKAGPPARSKPETPTVSMVHSSILPRALACAFLFLGAIVLGYHAVLGRKLD